MTNPKNAVEEKYDNIFVERLWRTVKYEEVYRSDEGCSATQHPDFLRSRQFFRSIIYMSPFSLRLPAICSAFGPSPQKISTLPGPLIAAPAS